MIYKNSAYMHVRGQTANPVVKEGVAGHKFPDDNRITSNHPHRPEMSLTFALTLPLKVKSTSNLCNKNMLSSGNTISTGFYFTYQLFKLCNKFSFKFGLLRLKPFLQHVIWLEHQQKQGLLIEGKQFSLKIKVILYTTKFKFMVG